MRDCESWISRLLGELRAKNLERVIRVYPESEKGLSARPDEKLNFSSNDYLNLSRHSTVVAAAKELGRASAGASRLVTGTCPCHLELEEALAAHHGYPSCLLFGAGYLANLGVLSTMLRRNDVVFADRLVHASLIDGIVLSQAKHYRYRHLDLDHLEDLLKRASGDRGVDTRWMIVTESVFSMDGDLAPLRDLCRIAERFDALLLVDEAHAIGVFGPGGSGMVNAEGLSERVPLITATLSKAYGSYGGFVLGAEIVRKLLVNRARPFIYNTALPPSVVRAARASLELMQANRDMGELLLARARGFRERLIREGLNLMDSRSHIVPLFVGDNAVALELSEHLQAQGVIAIAMRSPTVPVGMARLRFSVTLAHPEEELRRASEIIIQEARRLRLL